MHPLLLHLPHSSTVLPFKDGYCVGDAILHQEILKVTDWYTDDLFENETDTSIKAPFSRIFCDTERFADDSQEIIAQRGRGVLYTTTDEGTPLRHVSTDLRSRILKDYYWEHHHLFATSVQIQLKQYGTSTIVDCHSFPYIPLKSALNQSPFRPDFNIGTDAVHTPKKFIELSKAFFEERGYLLGIDTPYSGTIVPMSYYKKDPNVGSIMLEINRNLYLKEPTNEKSDGYKETKKVVQEFLNLIRSI